jgi:hypothetical protein
MPDVPQNLRRNFSEPSLVSLPDSQIAGMPPGWLSGQQDSKQDGQMAGWMAC